MGDDGWGAASDNWPSHPVTSEQNRLREEAPSRTADVTARCMVELYDLQSGILDREQQVVQPFIDQVLPSGSPFLRICKSDSRPSRVAGNRFLLAE